MWRPGPIEIIGILLLILLLFGPGRIGKVAGELGKGIKNFRDGLSGKSDGEDEPAPKDSDKKS